MATAGTDGRSFGVAARKLEGGYGVLLRLGIEFFELRFSNFALTFSFNLPTVEHDTDPENTAMATAGTDGRSFGVAARKLEGEVLLPWRRVFRASIFEHRAHFFFQFTHCRARHGPGEHGHGDSGHRRAFFRRRRSEIRRWVRVLLRLGVEFFELRFSNIALTFSFNLPTVEHDTDPENTATAIAGTERAFFRRRRSEIRRWVRCASTAWHRVFRASIFELRAHFFFQFTHCRARHGPGEHGHGDSGHRRAFFRRRRSEIGRWVRASTAWRRVFRASIFEHRAHFFFQFTHCRARHGPGEHGHGDSGHRAGVLSASPLGNWKVGTVCFYGLA